MWVSAALCTVPCVTTDDAAQRTRSRRQVYREEYLSSDHWLATAKDARARAGQQCQDCGKKTRLDVHHLTYARLGEELDADLMALCRTCHRARHAPLAKQRKHRGRRHIDDRINDVERRALLTDIEFAQEMARIAIARAAM